MKVILMCLLTIILSSSLHSQHKLRTTDLMKLEIVNFKFKEVMRLIDYTEKSCEYYSEDVVFLIEVKEIDSYHLFNITSIKDKNLAFDFKPYGFYYYKKHLYLIYGNIQKEIFKEKSQKKFEYLEYDAFYEEYDSKGRKMLRVIIDDSHSEWSFLYFEDNFIFKSFIPCS